MIFLGSCNYYFEIEKRSSGLMPTDLYLEIYNQLYLQENFDPILVNSAVY